DCLPEVILARTAVIMSMLSKEIKKLFNHTAAKTYNGKLPQLHDLIEKFFREEKNVDFYAKKLNISASYLTKICRWHINTSPNQLIIQHTILEAKRLLKSTDLSIKEIAFELGFVDAPYFSNFFKQHVDMTPKQFRSK